MKGNQDTDGVDGDSKEPDPDDDFVRLQYERTHENLRHYQTHVWKLLSVVVGINAGVILVAYRYVSNILAKSALLAIGFLLTVSTAYSAIKHRHFAISNADTLLAIEEYLNEKHVQIKTNPLRDNSAYWNPTGISGWKSYSGATLFIRVLGVLAVILLFLFVDVITGELISTTINQYVNSTISQ